MHELTALLGGQQSLISYHLSLLRKADRVRTRRSSADGRDIYYHLDLAAAGSCWRRPTGRCTQACGSPHRPQPPG